MHKIAAVREKEFEHFAGKPAKTLRGNPAKDKINYL